MSKKLSDTSLQCVKYVKLNMLNCTCKNMQKGWTQKRPVRMLSITTYNNTGYSA